MRHNRDDKRFSRPLGHLRCMMANLTNSLFESGRIKTTAPKAKELRRYAEKMITLGKRGDVASRRRAMAFMRKKEVVTKLFDEIAPTYKKKKAVPAKKAAGVPAPSGAGREAPAKKTKTAAA